jgi:hypothetical protein
VIVVGVVAVPSPCVACVCIYNKDILGVSCKILCATFTRSFQVYITAVMMEAVMEGVEDRRLGDIPNT